MAEKVPYFNRITVGPQQEEEERIELSRDATIEDIRARFYTGNELSTKLELLHKDHETENVRSLVELNGADGIYGDDDDYEWQSTRSVKKDDEIIVRVTNSDPQNTYNVMATMSIDYRGGSSGIIDLLRNLVM